MSHPVNDLIVELGDVIGNTLFVLIVYLILDDRIMIEIIVD